MSPVLKYVLTIFFAGFILQSFFFEQDFLEVGKNNSVQLAEPSLREPLTFQYVYGNIYDQEAAKFSIEEDNPGSVMVGTQFLDGKNVIYFLRIDDQGEKTVSKIYSESEFDLECQGIEKVDNNGYIIYAKANVHSEDKPDVYVLRIDSNGTVLWTKSFQAIFDDKGLRRIVKVIHTQDGGFMVLGDIWGFFYLAIKLDHTGSKVFSKVVFNTTISNLYYATDIQQTMDGGYITTGFAGIRLSMIKFDENFNLQWQNSFGSSDCEDFGAMVVEMDDGSFISAGYTKSYGQSTCDPVDFSGSSDAFIVKTTDAGAHLWTKVLGSEHIDRIYRIQKTPDNQVLLSIRQHVDTIDTDNVFVRLKPEDASIIWSKKIDSDTHELLEAIEKEDGGFLISGSTNGFGSGHQDHVIFQLDENFDAPGCFSFEDYNWSTEESLVPPNSQLNHSSATPSIVETIHNVNVNTELQFVRKTSCDCVKAVTNLYDDGGGSLRYAISCSNQLSGPDSIRFYIDPLLYGEGPYIIKPLTSLPTITGGSLVIDATTQPNWYLGLIELNGGIANGPLIFLRSNDNEVYGFRLNNSLGVGSHGVYMQFAHNNIVGNKNKPNWVTNCTSGIVAASASSSNKVEGNIIGTDLNFNEDMGMSLTGIAFILQSNNNKAIDNIIAFSDRAAIMINQVSKNNLLSQNSIYCNKLGNQDAIIDIDNPYSSPSIIYAYPFQAGGKAIAGDTVEVFLSEDYQCPGRPCQGKDFLGSAIADELGEWSILVSDLPIGAMVIATATQNHNTSEYSECVPVTLTCQENDSLLLVDLYLANNGPDWTDPWNLETPIATWEGIELHNDEGCVKSINLVNRGLTGILDTPFDEFAGLQYLTISGNPGLIGSIPLDIGRIKHLKLLDLSNNNLEDGIPPDLGDIGDLEGLILNGNNFTGCLPAELSQLENLTTFDASNNAFDCASIPTELITLCTLDEFNLDNNNELGLQFGLFCTDGSFAAECFVDQFSVNCIDTLVHLAEATQCGSVLDDLSLLENVSTGLVSINDNYYAYIRKEYLNQYGLEVDTIRFYGCAGLVCETCIEVNNHVICKRNVLDEQYFSSLEFLEAWNCDQGEIECFEDFVDELNYSTLGNGTGLSFTTLMDGDCQREVAVFGLGTDSRIEYELSEQIPKEGTLEWWIYVEQGYRYHNFEFQSGLDTAVVFSTVNLTGDVIWPGNTRVWVSGNGTIALEMSTSKFDTTPVQRCVAENTPFRFGQWHSLGITYGHRGQIIMLDGEVVASCPENDQSMHVSGNFHTQNGIPALGEYQSPYSLDDQWEEGFEGYVDRFRISNGQQHWKIVMDVNDCPPVGIDAETNKELSVYPNPVSGELNIVSESHSIKGKVEIIDITGTTQLSQKISAKHFKIDMSVLIPGIYFLKIEESRMPIYIRKLVVH